LPDAASRKKLELHDEGSVGHIDTARADKDETVADFYEKNGNYEGAYLRYKDAVMFNPDDPDAHYLMAEMAQKTGKNADAMREYAAGLKLDPKNKRAKEARKALAELQASAAKK
jgi:tetratricopeptide (TPR) repeat protein